MIIFPSCDDSDSMVVSSATVANHCAFAVCACSCRIMLLMLYRDLLGRARRGYIQLAPGDYAGPAGAPSKAASRREPSRPCVPLSLCQPGHGWG